MIIVFCNNIRTVPYVDGSKCNKIIDYVDAISMNYIGASLKANWIWRLVYKFEANRLISYENKVLNLLINLLLYPMSIVSLF